MSVSGWKRRLRRRIPNAIDISAAGMGAAIATAFPTPEGAAFVSATTTAAAQLAKALLTERQESRIERVLKLAESQIKQHVKRNGPAPRTTGSGDYGALLEGTLLTARDSYEEKKVLLLANLVATAPFTNTPASNLIDTLQLAERLTYRQLCILSVVPGYHPDSRPPLTDKAFPKLFSVQSDEGGQGILHDLLLLVAQQLVVAVKDNAYLYDMQTILLVPSSLRLSYPARIAVNAMRLVATIPVEDLVDVLKVLGHQDVAGDQTERDV